MYITALREFGVIAHLIIVCTELVSKEQVGGMRVDYFTFKCRYSTVVSALACQAEDASSILVIYSKIIRGSSEAK